MKKVKIKVKQQHCGRDPGGTPGFESSISWQALRCISGIHKKDELCYFEQIECPFRKPNWNWQNAIASDLSIRLCKRVKEEKLKGKIPNPLSFKNINLT